MPERKLELAPDTPLFSDDDPLTVSLPNEKGEYRKFRCKDRANLTQMDPSDHQVTWIVEQLVHNVVEEEQKPFRSMLVDGLEGGWIREVANPVTGEEGVADLLRWIRETREQAEKGELARSVGRGNTKARRPSSPS